MLSRKIELDVFSMGFVIARDVILLITKVKKIMTIQGTTKAAFFQLQETINIPHYDALQTHCCIVIYILLCQYTFLTVLLLSLKALATIMLIKFIEPR